MDLKSDRFVTLVQVFHNIEVARAAICELKAVGFRESQIGLASHDGSPVVESPVSGGFDTSRTIVTVKAGTRADIAACVLNRFNRFDRVPSQAM